MLTNLSHEVIKESHGNKIVTIDFVVGLSDDCMQTCVRHIKQTVQPFFYVPNSIHELIQLYGFTLLRTDCEDSVTITLCELNSFHIVEHVQKVVLVMEEYLFYMNQ